MTDETTKEEIEAANAEAAASESVGETPEGNAVAASTASASEGNDTTAGETPDAPAESASTATVEGNASAAAPADAGSAEAASPSATDASDAGENATPATIPTTGGDVPTEPLLIGTFSVYRSRFDGQFLIKHEGGKGYSAPNASTAGHVASNLVAEVVQESINGKFEYAAGAA